jgi:hypothetical protein
LKPLILTGWSGPGFLSDIADVAVNFTFRFVSGPLPSPDELATHLGPLAPDRAPGHHWSNFAGRWSQSENRSCRDLSLAEFCQQYEAVELWFDPEPNDQLQLIWLLDYFRSYPETVAKLKFRLVDLDLGLLDRRMLRKWESRAPIVDVTAAELETASLSWRAYRAATPEGCFGLLRRDLTALPLLKPALLDLLKELPCSTTGLGATEMRMLELIALGYVATNGLFYLPTLRQTRVFRELEIGSLIEGLAHGPSPAVAGLDDELRKLEKEKYGPRLQAFQRSRLSLTEFGKAVLAHKEDFSRHNPIDRWWGGTHLTNDRLWRWDPVLTAP